MVNKLRVGLFFGIVAALIHLCWVILVWAEYAADLWEWILSLHFIDLSYAITDFQILTALTLVVFTFVCGFVGGFVLAALWNWIVVKK